MDNIFFPIMLVIVASLFQGTFGLGMKYVKPLAWEVWWLIYSLVAMVAVPLLWALVVVPDLSGAIFSTRSDVLFRAALFGFLWGVGGILFGLSVESLGVSITYGIVMGLAASVGSLVPLAQLDNAASNPALPYVVAGVGVMLCGVAVAAWAGVQRDRQQSSGSGSSAGFQKGLVIAVASGVLSALLNVGFANAAPVAQRAVELGAARRNSSLAAWVVVLAGAFVMNAGYALFLLVRNGSAGSVRSAGVRKPMLWAAVTGVLWFAALGVYGQGAALMGSLGPVVGWPILLGLALVVSNIWGWRAGEWKQAAGPFRLMGFGVALLIVACVILGYSNSMI